MSDCRSYLPDARMNRPIDYQSTSSLGSKWYCDKGLLLSAPCGRFFAALYGRSHALLRILRQFGVRSKQLRIVRKRVRPRNHVSRRELCLARDLLRLLESTRDSVDS